MDLEAPEHHRAAAGERFTNLRVDWETPGGTRSLVASADTIVPPGLPPVAVLTFEDITELERARRRTDALADAGALLAGSLDFYETLQVIARIAVPRLADWCFVELLRDDGSIDRVAIEADDPALLEHAREYDRRYPLDPDAAVGSAQVIRTGEPDLQTEIPDAMLELVAQDAEHLEILRALGFRSSMIVPLRSGGRVVGDLALVSASSGRRYGPLDLAAAQELADRCGLYLENARLYRELERAHGELEAILAGVADAVTVQSADGGLTYVNEAAVRLLGEPLGYPDRAALLAAPPAALAGGFEMLGEDGEPFPIERLPGRLALSGEEPEPVIIRYRMRATGESRWSRVKARPLRSPDGRVTQAINVIEDITDLKQAEERQRLLAEAGRVLAGSLDYEDTLQRVAWLAVPDLADWCMVDVAGEHGLERVAVAHADPARAGLAEAMRGLVIDPTGTTGPAAVAQSGRAELHPQVDEEHLRAAAHNPAHLELVLQIGVRSAASVPMTVRGQRLGVMTLSTAESGRTLGPEHLEVLEELGHRAAVAIDSARLYQQRSAIARTLQNSLLPPVLPEIAGVEAAALYRAAGAGIDVGGDFYDLFSVADDEWIAVIGDVCGKGTEAAAVTALARYTIRAAAVRRRSPRVDPELAQRGHVPPGPPGPVLHDHLRAPRHVAPGDPHRRGVRRASARPDAARRRGGRGGRHAGHAAGARARPQARGPARRDAHGRCARALHRRHHRGARARARARAGRAARGAGRDARRDGGAAGRAVHGARDRSGRDAAARRYRRAGAARPRLVPPRAPIRSCARGREPRPPWRPRAPRRGPAAPWPRPCALPCGPAAAARRRR